MAERCHERITLTRAEAHKLVEQYAPPALWAQRHRDVDALYDGREEGEDEG